ncbi:MAG: helix-turn-helix transcriptional regulator [Arcobacteraceae bacterium]|jgi:transcriptional regulator with XRE-family HTH domain|nr:helix-turn-helix transcriptional regulator [Arcobacteraceae bacterium]
MKIFSEVSDEFIEEYYKQISQNVKKIRIQKQKTQEEVALAMGFTTATFYTNAESYKRGKHFNLEHLIKLSKILNVPLHKFFET